MKQRGFTLIEVMIVATILAILAAVALLAIFGHKEHPASHTCQEQVL